MQGAPTGAFCIFAPWAIIILNGLPLNREIFIIPRKGISFLPKNTTLNADIAAKAAVNTALTVTTKKPAKWREKRRPDNFYGQ